MEEVSKYGKVRPCLHAVQEEIQAVIRPWEDGWQKAAWRGPGEVKEKAQEERDASRADHAWVASLISGPAPTPRGSAVLIAGPQALSFILWEDASPALFLPLMTVNSEYRLVEFWNFPLYHWPEVLSQLVVVLFEFQLVLPLVCRDETLVFLYCFTASEMQISGWGENEVAFHTSLKCLRILYI